MRSSGLESVWLVGRERQVAQRVTLLLFSLPNVHIYQNRGLKRSSSQTIPFRLLAGQENLRVFMCDRQKLQGRFPRVAYALFPAFYRIGAHIDDPSENCLARLEGLPDGSDLGGCERLWRGRYVGNPQCSLFTLLVSQSFMQRLFQITEHFHCLLLPRCWFHGSNPILLL